MPITPQSILPSRAAAQVSTATVISMGQQSAAVAMPDGLAIVASVSGGTTYAAGQQVMVSIPGGNLASAQLTGLAAGSAGAARQVCVPFG